MNDDDRIEHALRQLGSEHEPPRGWESRVLAKVDTTRKVWAPGGVGLILGAVVGLLCALAGVGWPAVVGLGIVAGLLGEAVRR